MSLKTLQLYYFTLTNHHVYCRLARLTRVFKLIAIDFQCCILSGIIRRISNYMRWILFICKRSASFIENINQSAAPSKKNNCSMGLRNYPKNIYLHNYKTETAIFLAIKHEKTIMACSYSNFPKQKIHQNSKNVGFCQELLSENDFQAVLVNFRCYEYGANNSEAVQKISTRTLRKLCQLTKTAKFVAAPMKK